MTRRDISCPPSIAGDSQAPEFIGRYAHEYLFLQGGEGVRNGPDLHHLGSHFILSGDRKDSALWLKKVDLDEAEGERFRVYEEVLGTLG